MFYYNKSQEDVNPSCILSVTNQSTYWSLESKLGTVYL